MESRGCLEQLTHKFGKKEEMKGRKKIMQMYWLRKRYIDRD